MRFDPISRIAYEGIRTWLRVEKARNRDPSKPSADIGLLLKGLPQGSINVTDDLGVVLTKVDPPRGPRFFDAAGIALVRLLLFGGGSIRFNSKDVETEDQNDYFVLSGHVRERNISSSNYLNAEIEERINYKDVDLDKVPVRRIIANTPPRKETFSYNHRSYRRSDLYTVGADKDASPKDGPASRKSPRTSRSDAIEIALRHLTQSPLRREVAMSPEGLRYLLNAAFALLNGIPLAKPPVSTK